ncbi:MAG TPA: hypothetical protein VGQ96_00120, partial [Candidatus Eremiobacteraceae bacterium]|nr:hypothetical protein [Candidatus Eremiobacteraceae bacterium]
IIKATQRLATLPVSYSGTGTEWESALESSGAAQDFRATRGAEEASLPLRRIILPRSAIASNSPSNRWQVAQAFLASCVVETSRTKSG